MEQDNVPHLKNNKQEVKLNHYFRIALNDARSKPDTHRFSQIFRVIIFSLTYMANSLIFLIKLVLHNLTSVTQENGNTISEGS